MLKDILNDPSLTVDEKVKEANRFLSSLPDRGVSEALQFIFTDNDPKATTYPANYLAILPGLRKEKRMIVEHILDKSKSLMIAAVNLVKFMPNNVINRLIDEYFSDPASSDMYSIIYEIALYFPAQLRKFADRIDDEYIQKAIMSGGPDSWVDDLTEKYKCDKAPSYLEDLSRFHTDMALDSMLTLWPIVPEVDRPALYMYIESSGVFPDTREASLYSKTYQGFVVPRDESPHIMGDYFPYAVPKCPICNMPATRILTLDITELSFDLDSHHNPSFFWYQCPHPPGYVVVRIKEDGVEGMMTPMTDGPVRTKLLPGEFSLLLEKHPNQSGIGIEFVPGFANHQVGGYPPWVRIDTFPRCPGCGRAMRFMASIDSGMTPFGEMNFDGILYGFWCDSCAISATISQD